MLPTTVPQYFSTGQLMQLGYLSKYVISVNSYYDSHTDHTQPQECDIDVSDVITQLVSPSSPEHRIGDK
jgi:hypothetical protein